MIKKIKRFIIINMVIIGAISLTACGLEANYPSISIHQGSIENPKKIILGDAYTYKGFDIENTSEGKDVILHFKESAAMLDK